MHTTTKLFAGLAAGAIIALGGLAAPAQAAPTITAVTTTDLGAPVAMGITAHYAPKAITVTTDKPLPNGTYVVALGYMTGDDSVVSGRQVEIRDGKAKGEGAKLDKQGLLTVTFKLNEFRKFPGAGGVPGGKDHGLKAFPKAGEADYTLTLIEGTSLTMYNTTVVFK